MRTATLTKRPAAAQVTATKTSFVVADGTIEAIKWLGLILMTLDHINKYLFGERLPGLFEAGRLAMPLFGFVLAYNLARPGAFKNGVHLRVMKRLALYGLIATPFFIALGGFVAYWWPLNIMFMLLAATGMIYLIEKGARKAAALYGALFLIGGAFVEFWWFALAFCLAAWWYCRTTSKAALVALFLATASLYLINQNLWALASMPIILAAPLVDLKIPRIRNVFYTYYPAHLAVLLAVATLTGKTSP